MTEIANVTWVASTEEALKLAIGDEKVRSQADKLEEFETDLKNSNQSLKNLVEAASVVKSLGWTGNSSTSEVLEALKEISESFQGERIRTLTKDLGDLVSEFRLSVTEFWRGYVQAELSEIQTVQSLARTLQDIPEFEKSAGELLDDLQSLPSNGGNGPSSESVRRMSDAKKRVQEFKESLKPESIQHFLQLAAGGAGAPLDLITKDVLTWLKERVPNVRFRVVLNAEADGLDE